MPQKIWLLFLVLGTVLVISVAQLSLKAGLNAVGGVDFSSGIVLAFFRVFQNPLVLLGLFLYILGSLGWLFVLSKAHLSLAYPALSLGYVFVAVLSWFLFADHLSLLRIVGLGIIVGGVFLLSRT
ncbi:4-amino-4-deoxy-L-arabinose transferase [Candidatus Woesearchaeota archaeon]|nr:4-amino-4-deoxy-L-arabinose transferase [Candidatus Woesearchaeota archaeon]